MAAMNKFLQAFILSIHLGWMGIFIFVLAFPSETNSLFTKVSVAVLLVAVSSLVAFEAIITTLRKP